MCDTGTQSCFKGDASFLGEEGCYPGTQTCTELGVWGPCDGGVHATDMCYEGAGLGCHPIQTPQFVPVDLMTGTGNASAGATTNEFAVQCPVGISPCPTPTGTMYTPLQSGEYTVTYTKDGTEECTFPLFVGAPGLRLELAWDWDEALGDSTVDLDLHLHKPNNTEPWGGKFGNDVDCAWDNCTADDYTFFGGVEWWVGTAAPSPPPPVPVAWTFDQVVQENNTCYYAPKGNGQDWQDIGQGCHNPRLDIDNITCDPTVTDVNSGQFCNPENTNVDVPPFQEWFRIGVHYYSAKLQTYDVHPSVKIFCNGALAAELGTLGYNDVVTFPATDGDTRYWLVADVAFLPGDECEPSSCVVEPLYLDAAAKTPYFTTADEVSTTFTPPYPPIPMP